MRQILGKQFTIERSRIQAEMNEIDKSIQLGEFTLEALKYCFPRFSSKVKQRIEYVQDEGRTNIKVHDETYRTLYIRNPTMPSQFMKMICPSCNRSEFPNKSGFLAHCNNVHKLKFRTIEEASLHCGIAVVRSSFSHSIFSVDFAEISRHARTI